MTRSDAGLDGYAQSHNTAAQAAQLVLGSYITGYNSDATVGPVGVFHNLAPTFNRIAFDRSQPDVGGGLTPDHALPQVRKDTLFIDSERLNGFGLGAVVALANRQVTVGSALSVEAGGSIALHAPQVSVNADLAARGGAIVLGNVLSR